MCTVVEEYAEEEKRKQKLDIVKNFISAGATDELIKKATGYTQEQIDELRSEVG